MAGKFYGLQQYGGPMGTYNVQTQQTATPERIMQLSKQIGKMEALSGFLEDRYEASQDQAIKAAEFRANTAEAYETALRTSIAEEAAGEDTDDEEDGGSGGFWSKLGDGTLNALNWTVDKLSRANYASANMASTLIEEIKEDQGKDSPIPDFLLGIPYVNPFQYAPSDLEDYGHIVSEGWDGLKGEDKTTYSKVLEEDLGWEGESGFSRWTKEGVGLALDVGLDPTTYVGVGLVKTGVKTVGSKLGLKAGEEVGEEAAEVGAKTVDDIVTGGTRDSDLSTLVREDGTPLRDDEVSLINDITRLGLENVNRTTGEVAVFDHVTAASLLGIDLATGTSRKALTKVQRVARINDSLAKLNDIKTQLAEKISSNEPIVDDVIQRLDERIADLKANKVFKTDLVDEEYVRQASSEILERMKKDGTYPEIPKSVDKLVMGTGKTTIDLKTLPDILIAERQIKYLKKKLTKGRDSQTEAHLARAETQLAEANNQWWNSGLVDEGFKASVAKDLGEGALTKDPEWQRLMGKDGKGTEGSIVRLNQEYKRLTADANRAHSTKARNDIIAKRKDVGAKLRRDMDTREKLIARAMREPLEHHLADQLLKVDPTYKAMVQEAELLGEKIYRETGSAVTTTDYLQMGFNVGNAAVKTGDSVIADSGATISRKMDELTDEVVPDDPMQIGSMKKKTAPLEAGGLQGDLLELNNRIAQYKKDFIKSNTSFLRSGQVVNKPAKITEADGKTLTPEGKLWKDELESQKSNLRAAETDKLTESKLRSKRAQAKSSEDAAQRAASGASEAARKQASGEAGFKVVVDGKLLSPSEFAKDAAKHVTPADEVISNLFNSWRKTAPRADEAWEILQDSATAAKGITRKEFDILFDRYLVGPDALLRKSQAILKPAAIAFDRLFAKQVGKSPKEFLSGVKQGTAEQTLKLPTGESVSINRYFNARKKDLESENPKLRSDDDYYVTESGQQLSRKYAVDTNVRFFDMPEELAQKQFDQELLQHLADDADFAAKVDKRWRRDWSNKVRRTAQTSGKVAPASEKKELREAFNLNAADRREIAEEVERRVSKQFPDDLNELTISTKSTRPIEIPEMKMQKASDEANLVMAQRQVAEQDAMMKASAMLQDDKTLRQQMLKEIAAVTKQRNVALNLAKKEMRKTHEAMSKRLEEQMLLNLAHNTVGQGEKVALRLGFAGKNVFLDIPMGHKLTKAMEKLGTLKVIESASRAWRAGFLSSKGMDPAMDTARLRMNSDTNRLIKLHIETLRHDFGRYSPKQRRRAFDYFKKHGAVGASDDLDKKTQDFFDQAIDYFNGTIKIGDLTLTSKDVERFLPDEMIPMKLPGEKATGYYKDGQDLLKHMFNIKPGTDPLKVMWRVSIAAEQAMAWKNMQHTIRKTFGVNRPTEKRNPYIETLIEKHDWRTSRNLGDDIVFPPDIADDVEHLMDMVQPRRVNEMMKVYDKAITGVKSMMTIYNIPGYYLRNGIGEVIMGTMDGLTNPKYYNRAKNILMAKQPDSVKEALKEIDPWAKHQTSAQKSAMVVATLAHGRKINAEEAWVLYNQSGLKSGFISSEYDHYMPSLGTFKATGMGRALTKVNDKVREKGEKFEDYFRLAHFLHSMEKSGLNNPLKAAEWASQKVRKYHFDYTDFTPFEKTVMNRLFLFYKWQRKSLPLMASMLFTQPGRMMIFPKTMQHISYASGATDPMQDENGFLPNYEEGMPPWLSDINGYPINVTEDIATMMNISTPHFDAYKTLASPISSMGGMVTPAIKIPVELMTGTNLQTGQPIWDKSDYWMRQIPQTNIMNKFIKEGESDKEGFPVSPTLASWLSGLGLYEIERPKGEESEEHP